MRVRCQTSHPMGFAPSAGGVTGRRHRARRPPRGHASWTRPNSSTSSSFSSMRASFHETVPCLNSAGDDEGGMHDGGTYRVGRRGFHGQDPQHRLPQRRHVVRVRDPSVETAAVTDFDPALSERAARDWGWVACGAEVGRRSRAPTTRRRRHLHAERQPRRHRARRDRSAASTCLCEKPLALDGDSCLPVVPRRRATATGSPRSASCTASGRPWPWLDKLIDEGAIGSDPHRASPVPARLQRQSRTYR